jgi:hypothetical protein
MEFIAYIDGNFVCLSVGGLEWGRVEGLKEWTGALGGRGPGVSRFGQWFRDLSAQGEGHVVSRVEWGGGAWDGVTR